MEPFLCFKQIKCFSNYEAEKDELCTAKLGLEQQVAKLTAELSATKAKNAGDAESVGQEVSKMSEIIETLTQDKERASKWFFYQIWAMYSSFGRKSSFSNFESRNSFNLISS